MNDNWERWAWLAFTVPLVLWTLINWPDLLIVALMCSVLAPDAWRER